MSASLHGAGFSFNPDGAEKHIITKSALAVALLLAVLLTPAVSHSSPNADELMWQVYKQSCVQKSQRMNMEILIKDPKGCKRVRFF